MSLFMKLWLFFHPLPSPEQAERMGKKLDRDLQEYYIRKAIHHVRKEAKRHTAFVIGEELLLYDESLEFLSNIFAKAGWHVEKCGFAKLSLSHPKHHKENA